MRGPNGRSSSSGIALMASSLIIVVAGSEVHASRIGGSLPGPATVSDPYARYTPAELKILEEERKSLLDIRIAGTLPGPSTPSDPFARYTPAELKILREEEMSILDVRSAPLPPPVAGPVSSASDLGVGLTPLRPPLAFLNPTAAPEPSSIVLAIGMAAASFWRARSSSRAPS